MAMVGQVVWLHPMVSGGLLIVELSELLQWLCMMTAP